ncbi:hypothetical protein E3N88_42007 [Mikania micrantha]|uniref:Transposase MuDR plant domain-containing protein n=1 Tax=Mikania micrantha TaxID=192012 RepID=A0A5N6LL88_9ASTR|nr:hypothetical protein E3N88_42007 [Mikania micrantha]
MGDDVTSVQLMSKYKIKLKYGGYFRFVKNSSRKRYCFGYQKCIYIDTYTYVFDDLIQEVSNQYPANRDLVFSVCFVDKYATEQTFIKLDCHDDFQLMLGMYELEKQLTLYVTTCNNLDRTSNQPSGHDEVVDELYGQEDSEYALSDENYHSHYSTDEVVDEQLGQDDSDVETYRKKNLTIKVNSIFDNVVDFRRSLIHYTLTNEFQYFIEKREPTRVTTRCIHKECKWKIYASIKQDGITFEVKTFVEAHSCTRSNKGGNKHASQGRIASVISDKQKSDEDVSIKELQKWVMQNYNVDVSYMKVFRGKEQAYTDIYGKWEDSLL